MDCSVPSVVSSIQEWPKWLLPAKVDVLDSSNSVGKILNLNAVVKKKRPLIYVYDLPPDFNSILFEVSNFYLLIRVCLFFRLLSGLLYLLIYSSLFKGSSF